MAKKYQPAIFQPTVRPDWGGTLSYLSDAEKSEILTALVKFPSVECNSRFWLETIKPDLDLQLSKFMNSNAVKSRGALNRWGKISIPYPNHMDTISTPNDNHMDKNSNTYGIDTEREREKEKEDENKSIDENSKESIGGVGGKREKTNETSMFHVECQNFDEIPPHILPVMKKYWTDEKIEKIRKDLAFMSSHETSVAILLTKYESDLLNNEPKPKTKQEDRTLEIQFNTFWEVYPKQRKAGKTKPREKFFQIVKSGKATAEQIIKSAEDYAKTDEVARGFAKEPYSWLLNERYLCDYTVKQAVQTPMTAKERIDMINKQKTQAILQTMREKGLLQ